MATILWEVVTLVLHLGREVFLLNETIFVIVGVEVGLASRVPS
jgi:hypothetical protein